MDFFNVVSVEEARRLLLEKFFDYEFEREEVDISDLKDRILAEDIISHIDVPEFDRSTVDGYAVKASDTHGASDSIPSILNILGEVKMGKKAEKEIRSGQSIYVPTGGMLPRGADAMIMIENTEKMDRETLLINKAVSDGENIVYKGDDIKNQELVLKSGTRISTEVIGVIAALGISRVKVYKKPSFYTISTGDEIIDIDEKLEIGKIRDINSYTLESLIRDVGGQVSGNSIIRDDYQSLRAEVEKAIEISDIVLISGGSSVGTRDYTHKVIDSFDGQGVFVHGVSIKPGKPTIMGEGKGKLIFGLPGHPVSSIIVFNCFLKYYIQEKLGVKEIPRSVNAVMDFNFPSASGKTTYQMVKLEEREGKYYARPSFGKSGMISLLSKSQAYVIIEMHEEGIYKGEERRAYLL